MSPPEVTTEAVQVLPEPKRTEPSSVHQALIAAADAIKTFLDSEGLEPDKRKQFLLEIEDDKFRFRMHIGEDVRSSYRD